MQYVSPVYFGELNAQLGINAAQIGSIAAAENVGIGLASLLSAVCLTRVSGRVLAATAGLICAALNVLSFFVHDIGLLIAMRCLTGVVGEGVLFSLAFTTLGMTRNPDRGLGIGLTTVVAFGSLVLGAAQWLDRIPGGPGILLPLAAVSLFIPVFSKWMPQRDRAPIVAPKSGMKHSGVGLALIALAGMAVWFAAPGVFWSFAETAASERHIPAMTISIALAVGNAVGLAGSVLAAWQGARLGRGRPILLATGGLCLSVLLFAHVSSLFMLSLALSAFNAFWNYAAVYEMGLVVARDLSGRISLAISAAQMVGFAAGGFLSGFAIVRYGFGVLPALLAFFAIAGAALICFSLPRGQYAAGR
jgi:predicted MFS family arabinose efflux permease